MKFFSHKKRASSLLDDNQPLTYPRKMVVQQSQLLSLPNELLQLIVSYMDRSRLLSARLVCSDLKELAEPEIFKDYRLSHGEDAQRLAWLIKGDERRAKWLRSALVSTKFDEDQGLDQFPRYLRQMRNLRQLVLETPDCNTKAPEDRVKWVELQKQYESIFQGSSVALPMDQRLLPHLEECTLHFVDETVSLYPMTKYSSIFIHPTLKSLTLSCACTDKPDRVLSDYRQYERSTALEYVHFEECDFHAESLEILLQFPKALKSLKMSEGVRYSDDFSSRHSRMHGNLRPSRLSDALANSVSTSLESLSLALGFRPGRGQNINMPGRSLDLTKLAHLKRLEISLPTLDLIRIKNRCDHRLSRRLPSSLETIRVFTIPILILRGKPANPFQTCVIKDRKGHGLPNLKHIIYAYEYQAPRGRSSFGPIAVRGEDRMTRIIKDTQVLVMETHNRRWHLYKDYGMRMTLEVDINPPGYIPPYLNNEDKPTRELMWDSDQPPPAALHYESIARTIQRNATEAGTAAVRLPGDEDEADNDPEGGMLGNLPPYAAELFELLVLHPQQPFQL